MTTESHQLQHGPARVSDDSVLTVAFCGEEYHVEATDTFVVGRTADLSIDDNPYLHRRFLEVRRTRGLWWLINLGSRLSATLADEDGLMQAWLAPGARLPLVFPSTTVLFTAGPTTYDLQLSSTDEGFRVTPRLVVDGGTTTLSPRALTASQRLMVLALAEPVLRRSNHASSAIPSSAQAAARLGWTLTRFNRQLDSVCGKLSRAGERGLHGGPGRLASTRRARLVELAVATRLVVVADLPLLDAEGS